MYENLVEKQMQTAGFKSRSSSSLSYSFICCSPLASSATPLPCRSSLRWAWFDPTAGLSPTYPAAAGFWLGSSCCPAQYSWSGRARIAAARHASGTGHHCAASGPSEVASDLDLAKHLFQKSSGHLQSSRGLKRWLLICHWCLQHCYLARLPKSLAVPAFWPR